MFFDGSGEREMVGAIKAAIEILEMNRVGLWEVIRAFAVFRERGKRRKGEGFGKKSVGAGYKGIRFVTQCVGTEYGFVNALFYVSRGVRHWNGSKVFWFDVGDDGSVLVCSDEKLPHAAFEERIDETCFKGIPAGQAQQVMAEDLAVERFGNKAGLSHGARTSQKDLARMDTKSFKIGFCF